MSQLSFIWSSPRLGEVDKWFTHKIRTATHLQQTHADISRSYMNICIYTHIYEVNTIRFQTFFVWALLLIVHTWNTSPLRRSLLRLQCTCCTVSNNFSKDPWKSSCVSVSMTFVTASFISLIVSQRQPLSLGNNQKSQRARLRNVLMPILVK